MVLQKMYLKVWRSSLGLRTRGRKFLLQCRYAADANGQTVSENMELMSMSTRIPDAETRVWVKQLAVAVGDNREELDALIADSLVNWSLDRLTPITKLILEQAAAEKNYLSIPAPVAIKEAVRLAVEFEGAKTGSFVNGVLDRILIKG
ncbi:transcription antitermination factor NusB [Candidatus Fermentibacteria bacterium]|nr:MAG: transcription antitermination factor NusB [Candidatus Fermentibacteria bacterium]